MGKARDGFDSTADSKNLAVSSSVLSENVLSDEFVLRASENMMGALPIIYSNFNWGIFPVSEMMLREVIK